MRLFQKILSIFLIVACLALPIQTAAAQTDLNDYVWRMIQYYLRFQDQADEEIGVLLSYLEQQDWKEGALWRDIMADWSYINEQMPVTPKMLPDGLPTDDSLCIVILGYGLRPDGSMREELIDRLIAGLSSALKYPNAYVAVTGGPTSGVEGITEAGQMAAWLRERGIEDSRLIVENRSMSTVQNAKRVCNILTEEYPEVTSLAVVTSDYHIQRSCLLFAAAAHCRAQSDGTEPLKLAGTAVNATDKPQESLEYQARDLCTLMGIPYDPNPETQPELAD